MNKNSLLIGLALTGITLFFNQSCSPSYIDSAQTTIKAENLYNEVFNKLIAMMTDLENIDCLESNIEARDIAIYDQLLDPLPYDSNFSAGPSYQNLKLVSRNEDGTYVENNHKPSDYVKETKYFYYYYSYKAPIDIVKKGLKNIQFKAKNKIHRISSIDNEAINKDKIAFQFSDVYQQKDKWLVYVNVRNTEQFLSGNLVFFEIKQCEKGGYYIDKIRDGMDWCKSYQQTSSDCQSAVFSY